MELAFAMLSFFALVVTWFVLPAAATAKPATVSTSEALPAAA